jgi:hypothetical protein
MKLIHEMIDQLPPRPATMEDFVCVVKWAFMQPCLKLGMQVLIMLDVS